MAGMNGASVPMGTMPMMNNIANGATPRPGGEQDDENTEGRLNAYIYDYFLRKEHFDCARAVMNSGLHMFPALRSRDNDVNGTDDNAMQTDPKDEVDSKRPDDLPPPTVAGGSSDPQAQPFLLEWFGLFWDVYCAQRRKPSATAQAMQFVQHTQTQSRLRTDQQAQLLRAGMPVMAPEQYQMMRYQQANGMQMNPDLRTKAMQNRGLQPTPQQIAQMKSQQQLMQQQTMRRDPSDMDVNGQRARTPSSGDNAPSPSKRPRIENMPYNGQQMMPNGRGPMPGMQGQQMREAALNANQANQMLMNNGIPPENLTPAQFQTFQAQNPAVQAKSMQVYIQNQARANGNRQGMPTPGMPGQGSPIMQSNFDLGAPGVPQYMNDQTMMRGGVPPGNANGGNHALQDYQMQLMLLEQQNKKRLLMARQEQDIISRPDGQPMPGGPGYAPGMSPSGSRSGPSPGPNEQGKRGGTPKMGASGLPGSPMPDGSMPQARGSPAALSFTGQMPAEMQYQMNGMGAVGPNGLRLPPSSHPGQMGAGTFPAQQQMEAIRQAQAAGRMPNGQQWPQGLPPGQSPMMQPNQAPQPAQIGTPHQRNAMPPPQAVPAGTAANGARPSSPAQGAPPTPQATNKPNPKGKKDTKETRKRPNKKNSTASVAANATPSGEPEAPPTPTPATPITPQHPNSFQKGDAPNQVAMPPGPNPAAPVPGLVPPQPDVSAVQYGLDGAEHPYNMAFSDNMGGDVLENFDFDSFLHDNETFDFDAAGLTYGNGEGVEAGTEGP